MCAVIIIQATRDWGNAGILIPKSGKKYLFQA
jgi:hypothetical protein